MWSLILLHAIIASTYTIGKAALNYVQPIFFIATRMFISGIVLLLFCFIFSRKKMSIGVQHYWLFSQFILFLFYIPYIFDFSVLRHIDSSKWALLYTLTPLFVGLFSYHFLNESITIKKIMALIIGLIGVIPVLVSKSHTDILFQVSFYDCIILISVISTAYGWVVAKKIIKNKNYSIIFINALAMFITGILAFMTSFFIDTWPLFLMNSFHGFMSTFFLIIISNIFVFVVNMILLQYYSATFINMLIVADPLYVAFYGWIFLGETVTWHFFVSITIILLGLYLFYMEELYEQNNKNHTTLAVSK